MADLKLAKLPDRTPVRVAVNLPPELHATLIKYADAYEAAYGRREPVSDLIPAILAKFIESDRAFGAARKSRGNND